MYLSHTPPSRDLITLQVFVWDGSLHWAVLCQGYDCDLCCLEWSRPEVLGAAPHPALAFCLSPSSITVAFWRIKLQEAAQFWFSLHGLVMLRSKFSLSLEATSIINAFVRSVETLPSPCPSPRSPVAPLGRWNHHSCSCLGIHIKRY